MALLCLCSLVSSQLILDDKRHNLNRIQLIKDIDAGYKIASPAYSSASWNVGAPRTLKLANWGPSFYSSGLYNAGLLGEGAGLSSYTLGGVPAYRGSSIVSLTGSPRAYGTVLADRGLDLGIQGRALGLGIHGGQGLGLGIRESARLADVGDVQLINRPVAVTTIARPEISAVAVGRADADVRPVTAAVTTLQRTVDYVPVGFTGRAASTQVVNVPPNEQGLHINFVSKSSPLTVSSQHIPCKQYFSLCTSIQSSFNPLQPRPDKLL